MTKKQKKELKNIVISLVVFIVAVLIPYDKLPFSEATVYYFKLACFVGAYIVAGYKVCIEAFGNVIRGNALDECFLMAVASIGAFFVGEYPEAVAVMIFYRIGEFFQNYAVSKSRKSVKALMKIRPDKAIVLKNGTECEVSPDQVDIGETIIVKVGERIPLDGVIVDGASSLDTAAITGESLPRDVKIGDDAVSGCVNLRGTLLIKVSKNAGTSTVSRILEMVENASENKAKAEGFITRFAKVYTPIVVGTAIILAVIPPLILDRDFSTWIYRALNFLVVSCPCALVISVPLSFFGGIGGAAKRGILFKGSNYVEALAKADTFVFDKTGTLTYGNFKVTSVNTNGISEKELLMYAAVAERDSLHPIALSIVNEYEERFGEKIDKNNLSAVTELSGFGINAKAFAKDILVGNVRLMKERGIEILDDPQIQTGTIVYVSVDGKYAGSLVIEDEIKKDSKEGIKRLRKEKIGRTYILTGDRKSVAEKIADNLGVDEVIAELLPEDKVSCLEGIMNIKHEKKPYGNTVAYVGDGINDAPVLARADVGIAMGCLGTDAAIEAADVVIMTDEITKLSEAVRIAKKTKRIVSENVVFSLAVKLAVLILSAVGISNLWWAVFSDVGVCVIAILNSMRTLGITRKNHR